MLKKLRYECQIKRQDALNTTYLLVYTVYIDLYHMHTYSNLLKSEKYDKMITPLNYFHFTRHEVLQL